MKKIALITIHGMGTDDHDYQIKLEKLLQQKLGEDWQKVSFKNIRYASVFQKNQDLLWNKMRANRASRLRFSKLRKLFLFFFSDATALETSFTKDSKIYKDIQHCIQTALKDAYIELGKDSTAPVLIIAHSLGCQVISNYLWDAQHGKQIFDNSTNDDFHNFLKLKSLKKFITTGCNIPLFIAGLSTKKCFKQINGMTWDNYYDPHDILGWPLSDINDSYKFIKDYRVNVGGWLHSWHPGSHRKYWTDDKVVNPLAWLIRYILEQE